MILLEFHGWWVKLLKDCCYYGENIPINNFYDIIKLIADDGIKDNHKKFRTLSQELIIKDIKRINRLHPFNEDILDKLEMRNTLFSKDILLEEWREL